MRNIARISKPTPVGEAGNPLPTRQTEVDAAKSGSLAESQAKDFLQMLLLMYSSKSSDEPTEGFEMFRRTRMYAPGLKQMIGLTYESTLPSRLPSDGSGLLRFEYKAIARAEDLDNVEISIVLSERDGLRTVHLDVVTRMEAWSGIGLAIQNLSPPDRNYHTSDADLDARCIWRIQDADREGILRAEDMPHFDQVKGLVLTYDDYMAPYLNGRWPLAHEVTTNKKKRKRKNRRK